MRRLDEAHRPGGLTYLVDGTPVDANGNVLEDAPKRPENTKPEDMPHNRLAAIGAAPVAGTAPAGGAFDMRVLGQAIAEGLTMAAGRASVNQEATQANDELSASIAEDAKGAKIDPDRAPIVPSSATADLGVGLGADGKPDPVASGQQALSQRTAATTGGTSTASDAGTSGVVSSSTGAAPAGAPGTATSGPSSASSKASGGPAGSTK